MEKTSADLTALCCEWQKVLRLQDWDVRITFARHFDIPERLGQCSWILNKKAANIEILIPGDFNHSSEWRQDIEKTVVHELLHLHFAPIDKDDSTEQPTEQAIEALAGGFVSLKRFWSLAA